MVSDEYRRVLQSAEDRADLRRKARERAEWEAEERGEHIPTQLERWDQLTAAAERLAGAMRMLRLSLEAAREETTP